MCFFFNVNTKIRWVVILFFGWENCFQQSYHNETDKSDYSFFCCWGIFSTATICRYFLIKSILYIYLQVFHLDDAHYLHSLHPSLLWLPSAVAVLGWSLLHTRRDLANFQRCLTLNPSTIQPKTPTYTHKSPKKTHTHTHIVYTNKLMQHTFIYRYLCVDYKLSVFIISFYSVQFVCVLPLFYFAFTQLSRVWSNF